MVGKLVSFLISSAHCAKIALKKENLFFLISIRKQGFFLRWVKLIRKCRWSFQSGKFGRLKVWMYAHFYCFVRCGYQYPEVLRLGCNEDTVCHYGNDCNDNPGQKFSSEADYIVTNMKEGQRVSKGLFICLR